MPKTKSKKKPIATRVGVKKKFTFIGLDKNMYTLTEQQKLFAELFMDPFINGVQAIIDAGYNIYDDKGKPNLRLASAMASENLVKPSICQYIATLIEESGLNDQIVDKHLLFNVTQFDDLKAKNSAIEIYNKMKRRYGGDPSSVPPLAAPRTKREEDLTFSLMSRLSEYERNRQQSTNPDLPDS